LTRAVRISAEAFCQALRDECQAEPPVIVEPEPVLPDDTDTGAAQRAAAAEYAQVGWLNRRGLIAGQVLDTLSVIAHPRTEYYGWFQYHAGTHAVLVACGENESALVYRDGGILTVDSLRPNESPTHALLREFPDHPPAKLDAVNVRLADLDPDNAWSADVRARDDSRKLGFYAGQDTVGLGELWVAVRDRHRTRRVCPSPVRYRDTRSGRMLVSSADGYGSVAPAGKELLRARLEQAYRDLIG